MKKIGFTLTELLIALAVIGLLIAILMPVIFNMMPDQNAIMAKRAYYTVQSITSSLLNDEACYPDTTHALPEDQRIGFDDGYGYADCGKWGGRENEEYINKENANIKFLTLFTDKLDLADSSGDSTTDSEYSNIRNFTTKDGVSWKAQNENLTSSNSDPSIEFLIDVNGRTNSPDCKSPEDSDGQDCSKKKEFDRFTVKIHADGKIDILEDWAKNAVGI